MINNPDKQEGLPETQKYIEIVAQNYLKPGQNFFDQQPFDDPIQTVSSKTNISPEKIRFMLHTIANRLTKFSTNGTPLESPEVSKKMQNSFLYDQDIKKIVESQAPTGQRPNFLQAISKMGNLLTPFPFWHDYIATQYSAESFKHDGVPVSTSTKTPREPTQTYAKWVTDKISRAAKSISSGIDIVFPQDLGETPKSRTPQIKPGQKPQTRRWRILEASELTSKK